MMTDYFDEVWGKVSVRLCNDNGFCSHSYTVDMSIEDYDENTRVNEYGYTFLKYDEKIWLKHPMNGCYEIVKSHRQIDVAFNPEKYEIEKWLSR